MRRLTDVTITSEDRPAPPRAKSRRAPAPQVDAETIVADTKPKRAPKAKRVAEPKPRRRRTSRVWRRVRYGTFFALALTVLGGGPLWAIHSGAFARVETSVANRVLDLSARAGLKIDQVVVEGRAHVPADSIMTALAVNRGDAILGFDLDAARTRLAGLAGIKTATIERRLPGEIHVLVTERDPIAIWQNDGQYHLVDRDGAPAGDNVSDYPNLPLVVGTGAPEHVAALLDLLASEHDLAARVKASQWISGQRWNIQLSGPEGDIEVRLPEDDPVGAWHELAHMEAEQKLLERKVAVVDLRLSDRVMLRIPGGFEPATKSDPKSQTPAHKKSPGRDA